MVWNFRRRIRLASGLHINLSKKGASISVGPRGFSMTFGRDGVTMNSSLPGIGLYSRRKIITRKTTNNYPSSSTNMHYSADTMSSASKRATENKVTQNEACSIHLSINHLQKGVFSFSQNMVINELQKAYSTDLIKTCRYILYSGKCILADIQAELGISYQNVSSIVKVLEKAFIVKQHGNRRLVMARDEDVAIRLLLRYHANKQDSNLDSNNESDNVRLYLRELDPLFDEVARHVVSTKESATSHIQRIFEISYTRAAKIIDQLEATGIIGHNWGAIGRNVLLQDLDELEKKLQELKNN